MSPDLSPIWYWLREFGTDAMAAAVSVMMVIGYYVVLRVRVRRDPIYSIHFVNELTRRIWVESVMTNPCLLYTSDAADE